MLLMRAEPLRGQVGVGWALEIETFLGPEMATSEVHCLQYTVSALEPFGENTSLSPLPSIQ
jgi:hypothetical protein